MVQRLQRKVPAFQWFLSPQRTATSMPKSLSRRLHAGRAHCQ